MFHQCCRNPNIGSGVPTLFPSWNMKTRKLLRLSSTASCGYTVEENAYQGVESFWEPYLSPTGKIDQDKLCVEP